MHKLTIYAFNLFYSFFSSSCFTHTYTYTYKKQINVPPSHPTIRKKTETIRQIYEKQKEIYAKGDLVQLLLKYFEFLEETMKEEEIVKLSKTEYKKKVTKMVKKAAFKYFLKEKDGHKKNKRFSIQRLKCSNIPY